MRYDPIIHHRRSIRLKEYDYSQEGAYFITICTKDREMFLENEFVKQMIFKWWNKLPEKFPNVMNDEFIVMPNHIHGIIFLVGADPCVCPKPHTDDHTGLGEHMGSPLQKIIQWFKTMTTNEYIQNVKKIRLSSFNGKFWQRNYYEHIIRNEDELDRIREYIINNHLQWESDENNPKNRKAKLLTK